MPIKLKAALFCALLAGGAAAFAQDEEGGGQDYNQLMLQQAMKSGNYGQSQSQSWDARLKVVSGTVRCPSTRTTW